MFRSQKTSSLAELLDAPMIDLVMKTDGVDRRSLELLFETVRESRPRKPVRVDAGQLLPVMF